MRFTIIHRAVVWAIAARRFEARVEAALARAQAAAAAKAAA